MSRRFTGFGHKATVHGHSIATVILVVARYGACSTNRTFQLNSGQTTLAAIAVDRLRARGTNSVVSVFIEKDLNVGAANFLEDILVFIYNQLRSTGAEIDEHFVRYEEACRCGKSISKRTVLLRVAIRSLLDKHQHTFLVMDSYDRVGDDLQILLDRELADLRAYRLRVMLTRRVPAFKLPRVKNCDGDGCQAYNMKLYWVSFAH